MKIVNFFSQHFYEREWLKTKFQETIDQIQMLSKEDIIILPIVYELNVWTSRYFY